MRRPQQRYPSNDDDERSLIGVSDIALDDVNRVVTICGRSVTLTTCEYRLLRCLVRGEGRTLTRLELLDSVWGGSHNVFEHTVTSHINRLRAKIEFDPTRPQLVLTVRGVGYHFMAADKRLRK